MTTHTKTSKQDMGRIFAPLLNEQGIVTDDRELEYFSQDYFRAGRQALCVIAPRNIDELANAIRAATENDLAIYPRGAGYSYTDGYLHTKPGITIDMRSMSNVLDVNEIDMYVTVEAGCTWADLDDALRPLNLRTPFWGPLSGKRATVGGGVSQGAASLGSSKYGLSADSVLSAEVVTANGKVVRTGSLGSSNTSPFFRNYGPDMTGLFCGDCGALGVKAHVTLRLVRRPSHIAGLSFGFDSFESMTEASAAIAREGLASESFGMPASYALAASQSADLTDDLRLLLKIGRSSSGPMTGLIRMAKVALSGRRFLNDLQQTWHWVVEGPSQQSVNVQAMEIRRLAAGFGRELPNTIPTAMLADPFPDHDMLSPTGQRQLPPSVVLPFSKVMPFHSEFIKRLASHKPEMAKHNMSVTPVFATISTNGFLYEPVIAWDDTPEEFHKRHTADPTIEKSAAFRSNPKGRELAAIIRDEMIDLAQKYGGIHLQIGKVYPYLNSRDENSVVLLSQLKNALDPRGLMNPGALSL